MSAVGLAVVIVACGGADTSNNDVFGTPSVQSTTSSSSSGTSGASGTSGTSGTTSSSSSGTASSSSSSSSGGTSSGDVDACAACAQPPQGCQLLNPGTCDCTITCPDSGTKPIACTWSKVNSCPDGMYCNAQNCGQGTCVAKSANELALNDPQCGCDNVTYFNTTVAQKNGMSIRGNGACGDNVNVTCGGPIANPCAVGVCNHEVKGKGLCNSVEPTGACWVMPANCNTALAKNGHPCASAQCSDICTTIKTGALWYEDTNCGQ